MLRKIQEASNKTDSTDSVRWYTIPDDTEMPKADVTYNTIGFIGTCAEGGSTFKLYLDDEKTGAKTYHIYFKQLGGGNLTLTTGKEGATDLVMNSGTYVAIISVDENGNIVNVAETPTDTIASGNTQPATSNGVADAISTEATARDTAIANAIENALNTGKSWNLNAQTANAFKSAYSSYLTPAQASAMIYGNRVWPLTYSKNYLQTVNVTWDDYQQHNFPAGSAGMFFPGYGSNGGTLILVNYVANRMLYNVWIDSNRWSGWHYVDLTAITYN
jgi:hypothetical protein